MPLSRIARCASVGYSSRLIPRENPSDSSETGDPARRADRSRFFCAGRLLDCGFAGFGGPRMGLGQSLDISVTGMNSQAQGIQNTGNNLANLNSTAFKHRRTDFANLFYETVQQEAPPSDTEPGVNPIQFGLGVKVSGTTVNLAQGTINSTGIASDLFISGSGYFLLRDGVEQVFTRNGAFTVNANSNLVSEQGWNVRGFGVDENFNLQTDAIVDLAIPIGQLEFGQPTSNVFWQGTLNTAGPVATQATIRRTLATSAGAATDPLGAITVGALPLISDGSGTFTQGVEVTYQPRTGAGERQAATITLAPTDSLETLMAFVTDALEISLTAPQPPGNTPGFDLTGAGEIQVTGNLGSVNDFEVAATDFVVRRVSDGALGAVNLDLSTAVQLANGESVSSTSNVFDSNGELVQLDATAYLESTSGSGTQWRVLYSSPDQNNGTLLSRSVGQTVLTYDNFGRLVSNSAPEVSIALDDRDAENPLTFANNFDGVFALASGVSTLSMGTQDGLERGVLTSFAVGADGVISGLFDNGGTKPIGQVLLATFTNPSGLVAEAEGIYRIGPNSGAARIVEPGIGSGITGNGGLENSNVDFADELVTLINLSVAFAANSKTFATADELISNFTQVIQQS